MAEVETVRPNIRVEIQNNLAGEAMEVDDDEANLLKSDEEEGEINDDDDESGSFTNTDRPRQTSASLDQDPPASFYSKTQKDVFTTGINIFDKQEQEKRLERAKRFALKPDEICSFTDADLSLLYASLGVAPDRPDVRFETVHMLGTENMNAEDILEYFSKYAPTRVEWIDDNSCNIVWIESISAARALHFNSKPIRGMPVRAPVVDPFPAVFLDSSAAENDITLGNENRQIEFAAEPKARDVELVDEVREREVELRDEDSVDVTEITAPIPPGYWRLGKGCPKSKCVLLRFAFKTDKQAYRTETFARYYKKIGNLKGAPIDPRKNGRSIFERNKHLQPAQEKNPWGVLAKNWDEDAQFREKERRGEDFFEHKNPNIQKRLGLKRKVESESDNDVEIIEENNENNLKVNKAKFPRMRMYADEEEELIRRKKLLKNLKMQAEKISKQTNSNSDLRNVLALTNHRLVVGAGAGAGAADKRADLGSNLRNRRRNVLYSVEQEKEYEEGEEEEEEELQSQREVSALLQITKHFEAPSRLERPTERRTGRMRADEEESRERERRAKLRLQAESHRDREREHRSRRSSHASRLRSDRERKRYDRSDGDEQKPRSKVAVVVRQSKVPAVASRVWSRVDRRSSSSSGSDSESSDESESSESESDSEESSSSSSSSESSRNSEEDQRRKKRRMRRPGFSGPERVKVKDERRSPLKIEISNDHFKRK